MSASTLDGGVKRRSFLKGMAGILAAGLAPAAIGSKILMPVRKVIAPAAYVEIRNGDKIYTFTESGTFVVTDPTSVEMRWIAVDVSGGGGGKRPFPITEGLYSVRIG